MFLKHRYRTGFSMIEVLVFVSILSLFFVTTAAITATSLKQMKISEHRIIASRYAEDLLEYLRGEKDEGWEEFVAKANTNGLTYCFNNPISENTRLNSISSSACENYNGIVGSENPIFKREVTLRVQDSFASQVTVNVLVRWREGGVEYSVPVNTVFSIWE